MIQKHSKEKQWKFARNDFFTSEMLILIRKIHKISISELNSIYIYPLIKKVRRYIFSRKIKRYEAPKERYLNLKNKKENFKKKEDGPMIFILMKKFHLTRDTRSVLRKRMIITQVWNMMR
jgi:hypothetical protein